MVIKNSEYQSWGCPYCGYDSVFTFIQGRGTAGVQCASCRQGYMIVADDMDRATIGTGSKEGEISYEEVSPHPRAGLPRHDDKRIGM